MGLVHFLHRERAVRVRMGCIPRRYKYIKVVPLSVTRWLALSPLLKAYGFDLSNIDKIFETMPLIVLKPIIILLVEDTLSDKMLSKLKREHYQAIWYASKEVNDYDYIFSFEKKEEENKDDKGLSFEAVAVWLAQQLHIPPRDVIKMSIQYFYALCEGIRQLNNLANGIDADAETLTEQEKKKFDNYFTSLGIKVQ